MVTPPVKLDEAVERFRRVAARISDVYAARRPPTTDQVTPPQLAEAVVQFFAVAQRLDREEGETGPILKDDVIQLGDYGLNLLLDLSTWGRQLELTEVDQELETVTLAAADWIVRHEGEIRTLEPIVDALAHRANREHEPDALEALAGFMERIIRACAPFIREDLERSNPGRPWRVLHLNRGIVATRSHNTRLMEQAFDEIVRTLPEDAPRFFTEGMEQMEALDYPPHVRHIMGRYFDAWARRALH